jgi:hypothetical protein
MGGGGRSSSSTATTTNITTNTTTAVRDIGLTGNAALEFQRILQEGTVARDQIQANNFAALTNTTGNIFNNLSSLFNQAGQNTRDILTGATNAFVQTLGAAGNVAAAAQNTAQSAITSSNKTAQTPAQIIADNLPLVAAGIAAIIGLYQLSKGRI